MTVEQLLWLNSALFTVISALLAVVWHQLGGKIDGIHQSLEKLDAKHDDTHERVAQVEVHVQTTKEKVDEVDARRHRYQVENTHALQDLHKWITEKVIEALKP